MAQEVPLTPSTKTVRRFAAVLIRFSSSIGRDAAPVWGSPRGRSEAETTPRAESEAGT
jgi:hypothetical protein